MEVSSNFSKGFTDDEEEEDDFSKRDDGPFRKELSVRVDGKSGGGEQKATTPRSKHCVTEQRRRSKINDRFQTLRDLIPHSDQKRDKASFLLEVIEYVQFLQEKMQHYESAYPQWNQESTKLTPWKKSQVLVEGIADHSHVIRNGFDSPGFVFSGEEAGPVVPALLTNNRNLADYENRSSALASGFMHHTHQRLHSDPENTKARLRSICGGDMLNEEEVAIDEGSISISSSYSQGLLHALTQALQTSGIDMSQASVSVQINLGKRSTNKPMLSTKDMNSSPLAANQGLGDSTVGSCGQELERDQKRQKT